MRIHGRGSPGNPPNRFEKTIYSPDQEMCLTDEDPLRTKMIEERSQSIISFNDSPDVGFDASLNPYRGCEHGCVYCYARPFHEYLGFSAGLDFETKIVAKTNAPDLLAKELSSKRWVPQVIALGAVTDGYQPLERDLKISRSCLEVLAEFRNPVVIITKNFLVTRDIDLLKRLGDYQAAAVFVSVTTLNDELARKMEPRASRSALRLSAIECLADAGIPVGVLVAPVVPGLTDHELPSIIGRAVEAGARFAGKIVLRLPHSVKDLFEGWVELNFPDRKTKVINRIRSLRGGKLNDPDFGTRMTGEGVFAEQVSSLFQLACRKAGILGNQPELSTSSFCRPNEDQLVLFRVD